MCLDTTDEIDSYSLYLEFDPGVKHGSQYYVRLMHQILEVGSKACAQSLVEVGIVGGKVLQRLIKANQGRYNVGDGHTISL